MAQDQVPTQPQNYPQETTLPISLARQPAPQSSKIFDQARELGKRSFDKSQVYISIPDAHAARMAQKEAARYSSVGSMEKTQKLDFLKNPTTSPFKLADPYDGAMSAMHKWKVLASSPDSQNATPEQRQQVADNFYEHVIYPLYEGNAQKYGSPIPEKEVWMQQAYGSALKFDIDDAYDSHWRSGVYESFKDFEEMGKTGLNLLGGTMKVIYKMTQAPYTPDPKLGVYGNLQKEASTVPVIGHTVDSLNKAISKDSFWHDINPNTTTGQRIRSWAVEQAMLLPLYNATGGFTRGILAGSTGAEVSVPLTKLLSASERGNTVLKLLLNGAEGGIYGYTMADDKDKPSQMASGAVVQAILGTIFHFGGSKVKLSEVVNPQRAEQLAEEVFKSDAARVGWVQGDTEALTENVIQSLKGVSQAGGRPHLSQVLDSAFKHVAETEGKPRGEVREQIKANYTADPAKWKSVYSTSAWIRSILGERKLSTLTPADKEEISAKLADVIRKSDSFASVDEHEVAQQAHEVAQTPQGQQVVKQVGAETYIKSNIEAAQKAAKETVKRPIDEALDISKKRGEAVKNKAAVTLKTRTRGSGSNRSVSVQPDWNVYAEKAAKAKGYGNDLKAWLTDLSPAEFTKDLYNFYYPQSLKDVGLETVETEYVENIGKENPNLLAFMYNFRDRMDPLFASRLRDELIGTSKVQGWLNNRRLDEPQLQRYALGMKAHVDELLQTEKFKPENANVKGEFGNVYRSTYESPDSPTSEQIQLHVETIEKERDLITEMFSKHPDQQQQALTAYGVLTGQRADAFATGNQMLRVQKQNEIDSLLVQLSKGKLMKWEY